MKNSLVQRSHSRAVRIAAALVAAQVLIAFPHDAQAYRTGRDLPELSGAGKVRFTKPIRFKLTESAPAGHTLESVESAIYGALQLIGAVDCAQIDVEYEGRATEFARKGDGINTIHFVSNWTERGFDPSAPGTTDVGYVKTSAGWEIEEADLYLNANFEWSTLPLSSGAKDLKYTLTHELLHALGLAHPCEPGGRDGAPDCASSSEFEKSLMHPLSQPREAALGLDDIEGLCFLYGGEQPNVSQPSPKPPVIVPECTGIGCACTNDDECVGPLACRAGKCERGTGQVGDPCASDKECLAAHCTPEGYCAASCSSELDCARGQSCAGGLCLGLAPFGATCASGSDCMAGGLCLSDSYTKSGPVCTRDCSNAACPMGWSCAEAEGRRVCTAPVPVTAGGGACSIGKASGAGAPWAALVYLMGYVGLRRRKR